jgi:hypothetical protein
MNTNTKAPEAGSGSATKALEPQPIRLTYSIQEAADLLGIGRSLAYELARWQVSAVWDAGTLSQGLPSTPGLKARSHAPEAA